MPSMDDVYSRFGRVSELAQVLETELGTVLVEQEAGRAIGDGVLDRERAIELMERVNSRTLGQILKKIRKPECGLENLEEMLDIALRERNRLAHHFFRQHNIRIFTEDGRQEMMRDLAGMHDAIQKAYRQVMLITAGIDIFEDREFEPPTGHYPI